MKPDDDDDPEIYGEIYGEGFDDEDEPVEEPCHVCGCMDILVDYAGDMLCQNCGDYFEWKETRFTDWEDEF